MASNMPLTIDDDVGMMLALSSKSHLKIAKNGLENHSANQDASHSKWKVPFEDILWIEYLDQDRKVVVDYVDRKSNNKLKPQRKTFAASSPASDGETSAEAFVAATFKRAYSRSKPRKQAYVLINPKAGPGGAESKWEKQVKPLFQAARMQIETVVLSKGGEAMQLVQLADIDKYDTIIACSGDGGPHEIFNGLGQRPDAMRALAKISVGHIPCGSGNAMALNLYGSNDPSVAAFWIVKGLSIPLDLASVTQGSKRILSFLSQSVGLIAECDLGTEDLRWMGSKRFDYGVVVRLLKKKCYPCDIAAKVQLADKQDINDHYRVQADTQLAKSVQMESDDVLEISAGDGLPFLRYGTVESPLPEDWEHINGDNMGTFYCGNMAYMSPKANFFSAALPADGLLDLITMNGNLSVPTAIKTMDAIAKEQFYPLPHVKYKKVLAFRITPKNQKDGYISIDGERIDFAPFQTEIHPGLGRVMSKATIYEANGPGELRSQDDTTPRSL